MHDVMNVGGISVDGVNEGQGMVDINVHFYAKVPLVPSLGLLHFRRSTDAVVLAFFVFSETGRRNNGGVNDAALAQHQAIFSRCLFTSLNNTFPRS